MGAHDLPDKHASSDLENARGVLATAMPREITDSIDKAIGLGELRGYVNGMHTGMREGMRQALLIMLRARFGELPAAAVARIEAAKRPELEQWVERVMPASRLEDVLDPAPT